MKISNIIGKIIINGKEFVGNCVSIINGKAFIDDKEVDADLKEKIINVVIHGDAGPVDNGVGDITIYGKVEGNVETGCGDIQSGDVSGDVETGTGDVKCEQVHGNVSTGCGDIKHR